VGLVVAPAGPLGDVAVGKALAHAVTGQLPARDLALEIVEQDAPRVRDEVRVHDGLLV